MFLSRIKADAGGDNDRSPFGNFWFQPVGARSAAGVRVTPSTAMALSAVFSSVRVLAESFAVMPFRLYVPQDGQESRKLDKKHWLYRLFAKRPNRFQSPYEWRLMLQGHLALRGNAYCQIEANGRGEIVELLPLHPDRMEVQLLSNGEYRYRYTDQNGHFVYYTRGEIWHLRSMSDNGVTGMSPIELARESIGEGLAMQAYSSRFFSNDAKPGGGWIEYPGKFRDAETKKTFRDSWQQLQGGANRGKVAVLESGMKFHELGLKNSDAQFIEARGLKIADVARIFRVPPHKIGDLSRATFSNIEQQSIEFWTDTMLPYAELWESSIECFLLGQDGTEEVEYDPEFDMDRMMRGDSTARSAYYSARTQWGSMTPNEVRRREGDDDLPWLNFTMRPINMVKMDAEGEEGAEAPEVPGQPDPDDAPMPAGTGGGRAENVELAARAMHTRMRNLIAGNAARMARRIAAGQAMPAETLAQALGIPADNAVVWLATRPAEATEDQIAAALTVLALEG